MRFRAMIGALALAGAALMSVGFGAASAGAETMTCTWGGTPLDPTGLITLSPGVTNLPSTGPIQFTATGDLAGGAGCTGKLTFTGYIDPGTTCGVIAPFHAKATGLPPVKQAEAQRGVAGSQPVLLYDGHGDVVGSEQAQFLTSATDENDPAFMDCGSPEGLTSAHWSDSLEIFTEGG